MSDEIVNEIDKRNFSCTNSSLGWIVSAASPLFSFYTSYLQQKAPSITVSSLVDQITIFRKLKKLGTSISYPICEDSEYCVISVLIFSDVSKIDENGKIGIITGLLIGERKHGAIYHAF